MRRVLSAIAVFGLMLAALVFQAQPGAAYPAATCSQLAVSTTTPSVGQQLEVSGSGFHPNEGAKIYIGGTVTHRANTTCGLNLTGGTLVGSATTNGTGSFDPPVKVPDLLGTQPVTAIGASGAQDDISTSAITIRESGSGSGGGAGHSGNSNSSGLATTGAKIAGLILIAVVLIGGGALVMMSGRRRRSTARV